MKKASVFVNGQMVGELEEIERGSAYRFQYLADYNDPSVYLDSHNIK